MALDRANIPLPETPHASADVTNPNVPVPAELPPTTASITRANSDWQTALDWLPWAWLIGAPLTFALLATGLVGSRWLRRQSQLVTTGPVADTCRRLQTSLSVGRRVTVAICQRAAAPLMVGIVRPLILLPPAALTGWTPAELEMVLLHELAHVRRWDNLVNLLQRIVEALLFYHPAIWLVSRQVRRDREECCDVVVVASTARPQAYAELLVALAPQSQPLAGMAMTRHPLAGRIRRILKLEDDTMLVSRGTLGVFGLLIAAMLAGALWQPATRIAAQETSGRVPGREAISTGDNVNDDGSPNFALRPASKTLPRGSAALQDSPFLSLDDQRAADLAYKLLNIELEPLDQHNLKRVQAKNFAGGLLVADIRTHGGGGFGKCHPTPTWGSLGRSPCLAHNIACRGARSIAARRSLGTLAAEVLRHPRGPATDHFKRRYGVWRCRSLWRRRWIWR